MLWIARLPGGHQQYNATAVFQIQHALVTAEV
jgi:hypothetical protein